MGIKQLTIVILVFILLSSSVSAVDFEWALGYPFKSVAYNPPDTWAMAGRNYFGLEPNGNYFAWRDTASSTPAITGRVESLPILLIATGGHYTTRYMCGGDRSDGCQQVINTKATYNGNVWYYNDCYAECSLNQNLYGIANEFIMWSTHANYKCDARDPDERCQDRIAYNVNYAPIVTAGFESVFPRDGIKAVGPVSDLIPSNLLPENETVYLGLFAKNQKDVLFWFGPSESEPTDPLKKETTDYFDYINYCSDLNHNNICDYTDGAPCYDEGADWYGDPDWVQGVCCGADPVELKTNTGLEAENCTGEIYGGKAYCGVNLNGNYEWAPLNEIGAVHELLRCPGFSTVSDGGSYINCKTSGPLEEAAPLPTYRRIAKDTCAEGEYSVLSDYWNGAAYVFDKHPQSAVTQSRAMFVPEQSFDICISIPNAKAKAFLAKPGETMVPEPCDDGYADLGEFTYQDYESMVSLMVKGRVCVPRVIAKSDAKFFTIDSTIGAHGYLCSNGELFECKGDGAPYSWNKDFIADTGISTNDLVGSGGCPPKIVAYWPLDDGTARDTKGSYDGTVAGGGSTTGKVRGGVHLEQGDKITLPADVPVEGDQFTVEAWIKPTETSGLRNIIEKDDSFSIAIDDDILIGAIHTNQPLGDFGSRRIVSNAWHHVALTYDGDKASLYLDGTAVTDSTHSGDIVWSNQPIVIGGSFVGDVDEFAIYDRALRSSLIKRHAKMPASYCGTAAGLSENYYCAGDGEWTTDLDIKDESSCNNAGFVWTGNFCCSEDDDIHEYYNDHDTPPADLAKVANGGQTVSAHAGADISSAQIILTNKNQFATIKGPAKLVVETYSAESPEDLGACPPLGNPETIVVSPWEEKTIKVLSLGESGDPCRYRHKIITAEPFLALGGCWDKDFVPIGHFADPGIMNYHGHFYSCGLPSSAPALQIKDTQNDGQLVSPASTSCSDIKLNARGAGTHAVCNPGGMWQFTNNSAATTSSEVSWDITGTNASQYGCCDDEQCWTGFECVNIGDYYTDPTSGDSYFCEE